MISVWVLCIGINSVQATGLNPSIIESDKTVLTNDDDALQNKSLLAKQAVETRKYRVGVSYLNDFPLFAIADIEDRGFGWQF